MKTKPELDLITEIYTTVKNLAEDVKDFKQSLDKKAEVAMVSEIKVEIKEIKEKQESLQNKWWFVSGMASVVSWLLNHLIK